MVENVWFTNRNEGANLMRTNFNLNSFPCVSYGIASIMREEIKDQPIKLINKHNLLKVENL